MVEREWGMAVASVPQTRLLFQEQAHAAQIAKVFRWQALFPGSPNAPADNTSSPVCPPNAGKSGAAGVAQRHRSGVQPEQRQSLQHGDLAITTNRHGRAELCGG